MHSSGIPANLYKKETEARCHPAPKANTGGRIGCPLHTPTHQHMPWWMPLAIKTGKQTNRDTYLHATHSPRDPLQSRRKRERVFLQLLHGYRPALLSQEVVLVFGGAFRMTQK